LNYIKKFTTKTMPINKKDFVKSIAKGVMGAGKVMETFKQTGINAIKTSMMKNKLAKKMMNKEYVSSTMGEQTWMKRYRETKKLLKQGKMSQARQNLQNLKKQFEKENK